MSIFEMFLLVTTGLSCVIWGYLILFHHRFWLSDQRLKDAEQAENEVWPDIAIIIPARNEAETIVQAARSHLQTLYQGAVTLIVVDDQSTDGTGDLVRRLEDKRAHVVAGSDLPSGWSGKLWAVHNGLAAAQRLAPEARYVLLTDADIVHAGDTLTKLVTKAESDGRVMVSIMAMLDARGFWGSLLMPAFIFFFQKLYPFPAVNNQNSLIAGAAGGCMLIDRQALDEIGGVQSIKGDLIDDCALGKALKDATGKRRTLWLGFDKGVVSLRDNRALGSVWKMVTRTAFTQLHFSTLLLAGSVFGMSLTYLIGPFAFFALPLHSSGLAFTLGSLAYMAMIIAYLPTLLLYRKNAVWSLLLPLTALLYTAMTIASAVQHWRGKGGAWKGRVYG